MWWLPDKVFCVSNLSEVLIASKIITQKRKCCSQFVKVQNLFHFKA